MSLLLFEIVHSKKIGLPVHSELPVNSELPVHSEHGNSEHGAPGKLLPGNSERGHGFDNSEIRNEENESVSRRHPLFFASPHKNLHSNRAHSNDPESCAVLGMNPSDQSVGMNPPDESNSDPLITTPESSLTIGSKQRIGIRLESATSRTEFENLMGDSKAFATDFQNGVANAEFGHFSDNESEVLQQNTLSKTNKDGTKRAELVPLVIPFDIPASFTKSQFLSAIHGCPLFVAEFHEKLQMVFDAQKEQAKENAVLNGIDTVEARRWPWRRNKLPPAVVVGIGAFLTSLIVGLITSNWPRSEEK